MNVVDVIYAASPIYLYLNPNILGYLLRPLLEYQESHLYQNPYAATDLGKSCNFINEYQLLNFFIERREILAGYRKQYAS